MKDIPDGAFGLLAVEHSAVSVGLEVYTDVICLGRVVEMLHACLHAGYRYFLEAVYNYFQDIIVNIDYYLLLASVVSFLSPGYDSRQIQY